MKWSPEEISARLELEFPGRAEMRVSHETIYQSHVCAGPGALRRELAAELADRAGVAQAAPSRRVSGAGRSAGMVNISERLSGGGGPGGARALGGRPAGRRGTGSPRSAPWWSAPRGSRCWCRCPPGVTRPRWRTR